MTNTFKKVTLYTLGDKTLGIRKTVLENADVIAKYSFSECSATQKKSVGFTPTIFGEFVSEDSQGNIHLLFKSQTKNPNKNEVNYILDKKIDDWKVEAILQGKTPDDDGDLIPNKKEMKALKEVAEYEVLQSTFPQEAKVNHLMIRRDGMLLVDGNYKAADDILGLLRKSLGSLPCVPVETDVAPADLLDEWIEKSVNDKITLGEKAIFATPQDGKVQVSGESIDSEECRDFLKDGFMATAVEADYDGMVTFLLRDTLEFDAIKFSDELKDQAEGDEVGSFMLQTKELNAMVNDVLGRLMESEV